MKKKPDLKPLINVAVLLLLFVPLFLMLPATANAEPSQSIEITGDGVNKPSTFSIEQLHEMEQYQHLYSTINTWPTKRWYAAKGIKLRDLLNSAGIKAEARLIKFISNDGYSVTLTVQELLKDKRYYFPRLMDNHPSDGSIPGSPADAEEVEPILAIESAEGSTNFSEMNDMNSLLLVIGQRAVTEQTNPLFLKYVSKIEVLTKEPDRWDNPKANVSGGTVPVGTLVELANKSSDSDKIYYTTDGSTPTVNSHIYNNSAKRWWSLRPDDLNVVNRPIEITKDTVIKARTIGPGKLDSEVVTFIYTADTTGTAVDPTKIQGGPPVGIRIDPNRVNLAVGSSVQLFAVITPENATDKRVTWKSSDTSKATVDNTGLVTVVGPGMVTITATTVVGGLTASCIVNGPDQAENNQVNVPPGGAPPLPGEQNIPTGMPPAAAQQQAEEEEEEESTPPAPTASDPSGDSSALTSTLRSVNAGGPGGIPEGQPWSVYEVSAMAVQLQFQESKTLETYAAAIFLILLILGASRRYREYTREAAM